MAFFKIYLGSTAVLSEIPEADQSVFIIRGPELPVRGFNDYLILNSSASSVSHDYDNLTLIITSGKGAQQTVRIKGYNGSTKKATVTPNFRVIPDATSEYVILAAETGYVIRDTELAQGGGHNWITLHPSASNENAVYAGEWIFIESGPGANQSRQILGYNGSTKKALIRGSWVELPTSSSEYRITAGFGFNSR